LDPFLSLFILLHRSVSFFAVFFHLIDSHLFLKVRLVSGFTCLTSLSLSNWLRTTGVAYWHSSFVLPILRILNQARTKEHYFLGLTPCTSLKVNRRFGGTYPLHLQGSKNKPSKKPAWKQVASRAWRPVWIILRPWRWGNMFLRNIGWILTDYRALYPRRYFTL
jgi:hypothetical protein